MRFRRGAAQHRPGFERQGLSALAASLRRFFPEDIDLIAAHPALQGPLHEETLRALSKLGVTVVEIANRLKRDYLIGHKLSAMALLAGDGDGLLMDTDILAMSSPKQLPDGVAAVAAFRQHCSLPVWKQLYDAFGLSIPASVPATLETGEKIAPYFNSGLVSVPGSLAARLSQSWIETAHAIDEDSAVPKTCKRPFLDQISLPIAAARLGIEMRPLEPEWNFPSWSWRMQDRSRPILFHYQRIKRLVREAETAEAAEQSIRQDSAIAEEFSSLLARETGIVFRTISKLAGGDAQSTGQFVSSLKRSRA